MCGIAHLYTYISYVYVCVCVCVNLSGVNIFGINQYYQDKGMVKERFLLLRAGSAEEEQSSKRKCWEVVVIVISGASSLSLSLHPKMMILRWVLSASHGLIELTR